MTRRVSSIDYGLCRFTVIVGIAVLFGCSSSAQVTVNVSLGAERCRQVDVPGTPPFLWSIDPATATKDSLTLAFQPDYLNGPEFRSLPSDPSELYFAAVPRSGLAKRVGPYSKEKYAVSIHGIGPVRTVNKHEWILAEPLAHFKRFSQPDFNVEDDDNKNVSYEGKEFLKSGEHLTFAIVSANDRWLAVFSYDGTQLFVPSGERGIGNLAVSARTKHPKKGILYADIYNVETGVKAICLKGKFQGEIANNWFLTAIFLEDRYFFLNTGEETDQIRQFWICELPALANK